MQIPIMFVEYQAKGRFPTLREIKTPMQLILFELWSRCCLKISPKILKSGSSIGKT